MKLLDKFNRDRKNKKGFTLVELVVVLVILAILMAILIPSLVGYINRAREKEDMANARQLYLACQTIASEKYAADKNSAPTWDSIKDEAIELSEVANPGTVTLTIEKGKITAFTYVGTEATYEAQNGKLVKTGEGGESSTT